MKRKVDKRFQTSDDITSFEDFDVSLLGNKKIENKKQSVNTQDIPPEEVSQDPKKMTPKPEDQKEVSKNEPLQSKVKKNMPKKTKPIIQLKNIGLAYDREIILSDVNLAINKGDFVYLVGESGAGKSSIIKMLYREIKATKGEIIIDSQDIVKLRQAKLPKLRRKVGVIFQDYKLLADKTIYKNVAFSLEVTGYPRRKIKARVMDVLKKVGIAEKANKYPDELSGGQQQRAAIARAIVDDPLILVADEPTGNLDPENALSIMELLEQINDEGTTVVMATHDVGIVNNFPKRVILLGQKKVLKESQGEYIYE